ncbi:MAG: radical SAM protein [Candidatus Omnitrophota bacterium]
MKSVAGPAKNNKGFFKVLDVSLTRSCNFNCSWCNQRYDMTRPMHDMSQSPRAIVGSRIRSGKDWISGLNKFPGKIYYEKLVFSGGEPSLHPDFFDIVAKVKGYRSKVIITNLSFDVNKLVKCCRESGSRVIVQPSFHFEFADFDKFTEKMGILDKHRMLSRFIPVSIVDLPDRREPKEFRDKFRKRGYSVSLYKFEGYYKGEFIYADINGFGSTGRKKRVSCSSVGNCVRPNGDLVFCPTDIYRDDALTYGNICDGSFRELDLSRDCQNYGNCHISSASWIRVESLGSPGLLWSGKNFLKANFINNLRSYCERRNYWWLGGIKQVFNALPRLKKESKR